MSLDKRFGNVYNVARILWKEGNRMITLILLYLILSVVFAVLGFVFRISFKVLKWVFRSAVWIVAAVLIFGYAVPLIMVLPAAIVMMPLSSLFGRHQ